MEGASAIELERAFAATLPFLEVPPVDLAEIRSEVEALDPNAPVEPAAGLAARLRPHLRLYLLGLLSARLGDDQTAARHASGLEALPAPPEAHGIPRDMARTVRADVALRNGRPEEALALLEPVRGEVPLELVYLKVFATVREFGQEHARWLRAEALLSLRRYDEALRWYSTSFQGSPAEMVYLAPGHLRAARAFEARGERDKAALHYRRFVELWTSPDLPLQATVAEAKSRIAALGAPR